MRAYRRVSGIMEEILQTAGTRNPFEARVFKDICFVAKDDAGPV
jgi:hypothetical protein